MPKPNDKKTVISLLILLSIIGFCIYAIFARMFSLSPVVTPRETTVPNTGQNDKPTVKQLINNIKRVNGSLLKPNSEDSYALIVYNNDSHGEMTIAIDNGCVEMIVIEYPAPIKPEEPDDAFPIKVELYKMDLKKYYDYCDEICISVQTVFDGYLNGRAISNADALKFELAIKDAIANKSSAALTAGGISITIKSGDTLRIIIE